jgi:transcription elongation GreA/GreB family factor
MKDAPDKSAVLRAVRAAVDADLAAALASQKAAHEGATHEESKPENDKDTRGLEASYLARGLAKRVGELKAVSAALLSLPARAAKDGDGVGLGALVATEDEAGAVAWWLLAEKGGGVAVDVGGARVQVVTPQSPFGQALVGKARGDDAVVKTPKGALALVVVAVL